MVWIVSSALSKVAGRMARIYDISMSPSFPFVDDGPVAAAQTSHLLNPAESPSARLFAI
jgi:hypothetical protein